MKNPKEQNEKNAMQVAFVSVRMAFRLAKLFFKQPAAEASINNDPLTLRVSVNGASPAGCCAVDSDQKTLRQT